MADMTETTTYENAAQAVSQGKRHLLVRDYSMAVTALAEGCGMLALQHGEMADELGEPFLLYGRSLLCLAREEAGVLGSGLPGNEEAEEDGEDAEGDDEEGEAEEEDEAAEKDKEEGSENAKPAEEENGEKSSEEKKEPEEKKESEEKKPEEAAPATPASTASDSAATPATTNGEVAAPAKDDKKLTNGEASTSGAPLQNGDVHENPDDDVDDVENEDDDEGNSNLQIAWEVLELSKLILLKRGPPGWKHLAEAHRLLGEVAMESGNQPGALTDLNACLDLLRKIEPADPRSMAETHYQLGLAYSLGNEFDASIEQFKEATTLLETRIQELEALTDPPSSDDPFYTVAGEIKELKELLPEIQDKIADMRDFKQQTCKLVIEGIKSRVASGSCSNGAGPSGAGTSSSSISESASAAPKEIKPASDISHLVRKKRKTDEDEADLNASPCKKPTPEKSA